MKKVFIFQEVLPDFRIPLFNRLGKVVNLTVFFSKPTEVRNRKPGDLTKVNSFKAIKVKNIQLGKGLITFHPAMIRALLDEKPCIVILEARLGFLTTLLTVATTFLLNRNLKIVWWLSGYRPPQMKVVKEIKEIMWKKLYNQADAFICYGNPTREYLGRLGFKNNIFIAYNSLDTDDIKSTKERLLSQRAQWQKRKIALRKGCGIQILYVGRIERRKNMPILLHSIRQIKDPGNVFGVRLICIGGGKELNHIKRMAKSLEICDIVEFTGPIYNQNRLAEYFLSSDIFVLPGTGGLAINQAIAYGLPVILTAADGTERDMVIDGKNGLYFNENNIDDLTSKINILASNKHIRISMSKHSIAINEEVSNINRMVEGFVVAIKSLTGKNSSAQ